MRVFRRKQSARLSILEGMLLFRGNRLDDNKAERIFIESYEFYEFSSVRNFPHRNIPAEHLDNTKFQGNSPTSVTISVLRGFLFVVKEEKSNFRKKVIFFTHGKFPENSFAFAAIISLFSTCCRKRIKVYCTIKVGGFCI